MTQTEEPALLREEQLVVPPQARPEREPLPVRERSTGARTLRAPAVGNRGEALGAADLCGLARELAAVLDAGARPVEALAGIAPRMASERGRRAVLDVVAALQGGASLVQAFDGRADAFPEEYRAALRAGECAGTLADVLRRVAGYVERQSELASTVRRSLLYPAILLGVLGSLVAVLAFAVLPRIVSFVPGGRTALPVETRIVLGATDLVRESAVGLLTSFVLGGLAWGIAARREAWRRRVSELVLHLPSIGRISAQLANAHFAAAANLLLAVSAERDEVFEVAGRACGNAAAAAGFERAASAVRRGSDLGAALERERWVDPLLAQVAALPDSQEGLRRSLARLDAYYDEEVPRSVQRLLASLEPGFLLAAGAVVAFVLMASLMPIYSLYEKLA